MTERTVHGDRDRQQVGDQILRPDSFNAWSKVCHVHVVREVCFMPKGCEFFEGGKIVFIANKVNCNK